MNKFKLIVGLLVVFMFFTIGNIQAEDVTQLTFWDMMWGPDQAYSDSVKGLVEEFNEEHSNINVELQMLGWSGYYQAFLSAVKGDAAPDISTGAFPQAIQYARMDEILPLDSIIEEWKAEGKLDDFVPGSIELHQYNGIQAGIPWVVDPRIIVYRTDIFEELGIKANEIKTWEDFINASKNIKKETDLVPFVFAGGEHSGTHAMLHFMFSNGVGLTDRQGNPNFNDPKVIETLEFFGTLYEEDLIPRGVGSYTGADAERLYYSGKAAMIFEAPPEGVFEYPEISDNSAVLPIFTGPSGEEKRGMAWINSIMAYKQTENPEATKTFIKWWIENNKTLYTEGLAHFPVRKSFREDPFFSKNWLYSQITEKVMPHIVSPVWPSETLYPAFSQIEGEVYPGKALQEVTAGNTNYKKIAEEYNENIKEALETNK